MEPFTVPFIADQRQMLAAPDVDAVKAKWSAHLAGHGMTFTARKAVLAAYVSDNRWVADCPACNGGIACWDGNPEGCCLDCGSVYTIKFPSKAVRAKAEAALLDRNPRNRHWRPDLETPAVLAAENSANGL